MKITKLLLFIIAFVVFVLFMFINQMTVTPGTTSGNGNPALLLLGGIVPLFFVMILLWLRILYFYALSKRLIIFFGLILTTLHIIVGTLYQRTALANYRKVIEAALIKQYGAADQAYLDAITSSFSIHVNNQYFNLNTFLMLVSFSIFVASLWYLLPAEEN